MNKSLSQLEKLFNIENFNIYSDNENYYFFRSLKEVDVESIKNKNIIDESGKIKKLITDREFYGETIFTKDSDISLEEITEHIKKNYNKHTNCISFSSNANVALDYGRSTYNDNYIVLKVPKKDFEKDTFFAGKYMLSEVSKVLDEFYSSLDNSSIIKKYFDMIDKAKSQEELELIKEQVKENLSLKNITDSINYDALNEEQNLFKNKIILKADIMDKNIIKKIGNSFLFSTIGSAFSSLEVIHYKDINKNLLQANANILDIFGLLQQVPETDDIKEIKNILLNKLNNNELNIGYLSNDYNVDNLNDKLTINTLYKLSKGHISYSDAKKIYQNAYSLAKSRLRKEKSIDLLEYILNDSKYRETLDTLRKNTYGVEADIINRKSSQDSINISESVNLKIKEKELYILDYINNLNNETLIKVLENPIEELYGLLDLDYNENISYEEWIANSIIDLIDWNYYGIEELSDNSRKILLYKLSKSNFMSIYHSLKNKDLSDKEIANMTLLKLIRPNEEIDRNDKFTIDELDDYLELNKISGSGIKLKSYQIDAFKNINKAYEDYDFTSVVLPTGTGKSYVALAQMSYISEEVRKLKENREAKILYIAPNNYILDQLKGIIINNYRQSISESDEEIINRVFPNLTLCTYSYLVAGNNAEKIINEKYDLIIFDELHRTGATEWSSKIDKLLENQPAKVLGITATPERDVDGMDMTEEFAKKYGYSDEDILLGKHISYYMDLIEAIEKGIVNDLEVINCEYALSKDGSLEKLEYKMNDIVDLEEKDKKIKEYEKIRKSVLAADGIEKILNDAIKESGKYIVFIPLTPRSDGTYEDTETGDIIPESRAQGMMRSYKNLMNQFLFAGEYLKENKEILTNIYNKINENKNLSENEIEYLNKEKENILLLRRLNIKGCPNVLQTLSNDLSESITEYMDWDRLDDSKIAAIIQNKIKSEVESYTMLSENGKSNNKKSLAEFNSSKSKKKKFMFVMDMLNEGVHVEDVDGIIWLRPLGKNSRILFMQQLGRCITAVGKENKDRIPQIIDLVNNTLKVSLENSEENLKEDLQLIKNINIWVEKNRRMPDKNSGNVEELINYNYLKILKKKYNKYLDDNLLEKKPLKKKIIIKEIIQIGSNFDLWNYEFISKDNSNSNQKNSNSERKDLLSVLKIEGILRNFSDLYNRVEELTPKLTNEEKLLEYLQAMKDNDNKIIPYSSSLLFSDGTKMNHYWCHASNKDKIYKMITEESNPFVIQYKDQCEVLIKEYNKKQLSEEERLLEYLQAMKENDNKIIPYNSSLLFSDGTKMRTYCSKNRDKIYQMVMEEGNQFIIKYKDQCEVLIKEYNSYQEKSETKITEEEKLLEYLQAMKDDDNKIIPNRSPLLFSDGTKKGYYWVNCKDKIYKMITEKGNQFIVQYKKQCEVLIKEYNKKQLSEEERLLEYLQAMKENDNKIIPYNSSLLFSDGTKMRTYCSKNRDKIYQMVMEEGNQFIIKYKDQCEVLIKEYNSYQEKSETKITEEEKLLEYLQAMKDDDNKIIPFNSPLLFSDGTKMGYYWSRSNNKDKIYKMITEKGNPFIVKYKDQCEVLINEYNSYQEKSETKITEEEKLLEYLQAMKDNDNKIIPSNSPLLFSDGTQMRQYWSNNRDKIYQMVMEEGNQFIIKYKDQCEVLIKEYNKKRLGEEEKLLEYLKAMKENANKIIPQRSPLLFSDGTQMETYWYANRDKIYKMITEEGNQFIIKYKDQCEVLIKEYDKKGLGDEEKLLEYLKAMKENDNKIIPARSPLLFSNGTKMGYYWSDKKNRIYKTITKEDNQFVVKYKDQCEVLIKEYSSYQEKSETKITEEEKLLEYLQTMKDNDNKIIPFNSPLLFSDGTQMRQYWGNNRDKIYQMVMEEGNPFIAQYKEQCEVLIKEYNKKGLGDEEKLLEYLKAMKENDNKIIPARSPLLFSNGTKMGYYWSDKKNRIYKTITKEDNQFVVKYKDQCEVLIKEYSSYQEKSETKITEEEKLLEYLQAIKENDNKIIPYNSSLLFSDGTQMGYYWRNSNNKDKIYQMVIEESNPFIIKYKEQCEVLINKYIEFQEKKKKKQEKYKKSESDFREESSFDKTLKNEKGKCSNEGKKVL